MQEETAEVKMRTEAFSISEEDSDTITALAALAHKYNRSAALRAILEEYRQRVSSVPAEPHAPASSG